MDRKIYQISSNLLEKLTKAFLPNSVQLPVKEELDHPINKRLINASKEQSLGRVQGLIVSYQKY